MAVPLPPLLCVAVCNKPHRAADEALESTFTRPYTEPLVQREPPSALPGAANGASAVSLVDGFQRITDTDLSPASAFGFWNGVSSATLVERRVCTPAMMLGLSLSLAAISTKTDWTQRSHGASVAFVNSSACSPTACRQAALPAAPPCCPSFRSREENNRTLQENLPLLMYIKKGERQHPASAYLEPSLKRDQKRENHRDLREFSGKMSRTKHVPLCQAR